MKEINDFLFFDVLRTDEQWKNFGLDIDKETSLHILEEALKFASTVLWPLNSIGDKQGCSYNPQTKEVFTPQGFKTTYDQFCQAGWNAVDIEEKFGGQNLPNSLSVEINNIFSGNNMAFCMYPGLTHGAFNVLNHFGTPEVHEKIIPFMISGEYSGTMCLTESQCGSDLSLVKTKVKSLDYSQFNMQAYEISGNKIFISSGEHDLTKNILHLVLAKTDTEAQGTKGISLFLVPKFKLDTEAKTLIDHNGVSCIGIEHKMGIKASSTAQLAFEKSVGFLIGEENKGLQYMFAMMNEARLQVGVQGLSLSEKAFELSLAYAKERIAGKSLYPEFKNETHSLIINHPDVRKMLMRQFSKIVPGKYLVYWAAQQLDVLKYSQDLKEKSKAKHLVALLTPIIKSFLTDQSVSNTNDAMQIFGGHGYLHDYHVEQLYRDARITPIYEGTNTIQALDLLGRKVLGKNGSAMIKLAQEIAVYLENYMEEEFVDDSATVLEVIGKLQSQSIVFMKEAMKNPAYVAAIAKDFLDLIGYILYAYAWLKIVETPEASEQLKQGAHFYFNQEFVQVYSLMEKFNEPLKGIDNWKF